MKRNTALKILNPVLALFFVSQAVTALFHDYISRDAFRIFHMNSGRIFIALVILHLILNFNWVKANFFPSKS
jgi:hypothetical protein